MKILIKSILILFLISISVYSQNLTTAFLEDETIQPVNMIVDIQHIKIDIKIDPYKQIVNGTANVTFKTFQKSTDSIIFDTPEMTFNEVTLEGSQCKITKYGNRTAIYPLKKLDWLKVYDLKIKYTSNPSEGLYFVGWNDPKQIKRKQIWAHSPSAWFPFVNQKHDLLTTEVIVTFDSKYKVFSNGDRLSVKDNNDGTKTWHYKIDKPHVVYLICLVIGEYDFKETHSKSGVPMELWYYPDQKDRVETAYLYSEQMIDFFEDELGVKYPWNSYRQAPCEDYLYGGMETTTATVFGGYMFVDNRAWWMRNYVNVNAHELSHQWFGNFVSHLNNRHTWLTESFATYCGKQFERSVFGEDYYQWERDKELTRTFNAAKINNNPVMHSAAGTDRWYPKGSLVLDMLKYVLGVDEFKLSIKNYMERNANQVTETYDLLKAIRQTTGKSLDWFFDEWLYRGGEPHYKISYKNINNNNSGEIQVKIEQIHKVDDLIKYFKMPIEIEVYYKDGSTDLEKYWIEGKQTDITIINKDNKAIDFIVFDPNRKIIKKVTFDRTKDELFAQALKSKNMIDRYDATLALNDFPINEKREILTKCFNNDTFHLVKCEIIRQLASDSLSYSIIKKAILSKDALIRKSVLDNITKIPEMLRTDYEKLLQDFSYLNVELALTNLTNSFPDRTQEYLSITKDEKGWRGLNIRIKWLEIAIQSGQKEYLTELINYSNQSYEFETRMNAFNSLKSLNYCDEKVIGNLIEAYNYWNFKLAGIAKTTIEYFVQQNTYKNMFLIELSSSKFSDNQNSKVMKLLK